MCRMTEVSGACDSSDFNGITILLGSDDNEYMQADLTVCIVNISIPEIKNIKFSTDGNKIDFISLAGNNMIRLP